MIYIQAEEKTLDRDRKHLMQFEPAKVRRLSIERVPEAHVLEGYFINRSAEDFKFTFRNDQTAEAAWEELSGLVKNSAYSVININGGNKEEVVVEFLPKSEDTHVENLVRKCLNKYFGIRDVSLDVVKNFQTDVIMK